jgi:hypothetical protein
MRETHFKFLQYLTGIGIFFLVGLHLLISHLSSGEPYRMVISCPESSKRRLAHHLHIDFDIWHLPCYARNERHYSRVLTPSNGSESAELGNCAYWTGNFRLRGLHTHKWLHGLNTKSSKER